MPNLVRYMAKPFYLSPTIVAYFLRPFARNRFGLINDLPLEMFSPGYVFTFGREHHPIGSLNYNCLNLQWVVCSAAYVQ